MGAQATFDYNSFIARYPEFRYVNQELITAYYAEAGLYHRNDGIGPVKTVASQTLLMNMVTAHICQLNAPQQGSTQTGQDVGNPQLVGVITSASEGSVSVGVTNNFPPGTPQWWQQTKYGAAYWGATAGYRTGRYVVKLGRPMDPFLGGGFWRI